LGQPPQILHQHDPQRDRDGPEFANRQRLDPLIGANEAAQRFRLEMAVGVRDKCPGQPEYTRISFERSVRQFGQLTIIARRQIAPNLMNLLVHEMKIVDEPIGGGSDGAFILNRHGDGGIGRAQHTVVLAKTLGQSPIRGRRWGDTLSDCQAFAMLLEPLDAKEFGADRLFRSNGENGKTTSDGANDGVTQYRARLFYEDGFR